MSKAQQLMQALADQPRDWTTDQVQEVANAFGLKLHTPTSGYAVVRHTNGAKISVAAGRVLQPIYLTKLLRLAKFGIGESQ